MSWRGAAGALCLIALGPVTAAAQPHPGGRWLTLETAHFHVHVRAEMRAAGEAAAVEAENIYAALAAELPPPSRTIELVVADNADFTNGAASEYPLPTALVYLAPPTGDIELGNYDRWLHVGLAHELTHVFELDLARGWWTLWRGLFGRMPGLFPNLYAPDWLIEGFAVYEESRLTGRGRVHGTFHRAILRAQEDEAGPMPIDAAVGLGPRWPDGLRPYAFGSRFLQWVAATWGDSAVPALARETARRPIPYLWLSGALNRAAGRSLSAAWSKWQGALAATAAGDAARGDGQPPAVRGLREAVPPRVSPDGREVLFADDRGRDVPRLAALERGTRQVRALARLNAGAGFAWDAAGNVVLAQLDFTDPYTMRSDLWEVTPEGAERRWTEGARLLEPDVAPDGAIVAAQLDGGIRRLVVGDSTLHALTRDEPGVEWAQPRFSPDGRSIAAVRARGGWPEIVLLDRSGTALLDVTHDSASCRTPAFSPDGAWLFWSSDRSGVSQLYAMRTGAVAGRRYLVTSEPFGAYDPAPAADSVYYLAYHHDGFTLTAVPLDTARWTPLSPAPIAADGQLRPRPAAAETASAVVAEHGYRALPSLLPQYWLPIFQTGSGATWAGALTSGQDVLGRHIYGATVTLGTGNAAGRWAGSAGYVYTRLVPWVVGASYSRSQVLVEPVSGAAPECCREDETGSFALTWRHVRWRWQSAVGAGAEYERVGGARRAGPVVQLSAAHLTEPPFAISLQNGWAFSLTARERWRTDSVLEYHEARAALTLYQSLGGGGFAHVVLGLRGSAGAIGGTERLVYGLGGIPESSLELAPGIVLGGSPRTFPVRGYPGGALLGRTAASGSAELRFPLALVGRGLGLLPVYLDRMSLSLFADAGAAWFPRGFTALRPLSGTIGGLGAELVTDVGAVYGAAVRFRIGAARALSAGGPTSVYVAFGPSF